MPAQRSGCGVCRIERVNGVGLTPLPCGVIPTSISEIMRLCCRARTDTIWQSLHSTSISEREVGQDAEVVGREGVGRFDIEDTVIAHLPARAQ
jgi:hypothetical protein